MKARKRQSRDKSIGTRVTPAEFELLNKRAEERGLTSSEFVRLITLQALYTPPELRLIVAELYSLRHAVAEVFAGIVEEKELDRNKVLQHFKAADALKFKGADTRIAAALGEPSSAQVLAALGESHA
jgi:hypothetical protein